MTPRTEGSSGSGSDRESCLRIDCPAAGHVRAVMVGTAGHYLVAFLGCSVRTTKQTAPVARGAPWSTRSTPKKWLHVFQMY